MTSCWFTISCAGPGQTRLIGGMILFYWQKLHGHKKELKSSWHMKCHYLAITNQAFLVFLPCLSGWAPVPSSISGNLAGSTCTTPAQWQGVVWDLGLEPLWEGIKLKMIWKGRFWVCYGILYYIMVCFKCSLSILQNLTIVQNVPRNFRGLNSGEWHPTHWQCCDWNRLHMSQFTMTSRIWILNQRNYRKIRLLSNRDNDQKLKCMRHEAHIHVASYNATSIKYIKIS